MSNNTVITVVIAGHAAAASTALVLGAYNLVRRIRGDRAHRFLGRVWVVTMYWTILSSFAIKRLRPGHFSWIHGLSAFTFITLSIGLWAALTGRVQMHRQFMTGSYFGLLGAFIGAVVVPARQIPQWAVHRPITLTLATTACVAAAVALIALSRRVARPRTPSTKAPTPTPARAAAPAPADS